MQNHEHTATIGGWYTPKSHTTTATNGRHVSASAMRLGDGLRVHTLSEFIRIAATDGANTIDIGIHRDGLADLIDALNWAYLMTDGAA
jgi:hypothetical protein